MAQSRAMLRYIGRLNNSGLYPSDLDKAFEVDQMVGVAADLQVGYPDHPPWCGHPSTVVAGTAAPLLHTGGPLLCWKRHLLCFCGLLTFGCCCA